MLQLNGLTIRNFMSIGNVTQSINFSKDDLVLVLGENLDLGGNDNRNGVGKSTIVNALSYALFGTALTNIKKDNLINKSNMKNMLVTLTFSLNGKGYTIERGRKPGIFRFIEDGKDDLEEENKSVKDSDEAQGENRHTQEEIVRVIGISHDMFKHILALNTYVEPFLALRTNDQRSIIEQLLGITKLSEKADKLKEEVRIVKDEIKEEEFRIAATKSANTRIEQNIKSLEIKSVTWEKEKTKRIEQYQQSVIDLLSVDIDNEISLHKSHKEVDDLNAEYRSLSKEFSSLETDVLSATKAVARLDRVISSSTEKICPTCNQEMDKDTHEQVHTEYLEQYMDEKKRLVDKTSLRDNVKQLANTVKSLIPVLPSTFYNTLDEAYNHKTTLTTVGNSLENELATVNPYVDQINSLKKDSIQEIDFEVMNKLVELRDHQEFLLKLLTNKDSFIRKKIIDQNLAYLNHRLAFYLIEIGLPHEVKFKSDLEVEITMYGKEFDFDNLSRGERTRLILSLSWSFRDVFESMNDKINLLFIDELIDSGLDTSGVEASLSILKKMSREHKRNIFLISHRDELVGRVTNVLKVIKEGGFTSLETTDTQV